MRRLFTLVLTFAIATLLPHVSIAQPNSKLPVRTVFMDWNSSTNAWDSVSSFVYQYDNLGRMINSIEYRNNGSAIQMAIAYNNSGYEVERLATMLVNGEWINGARSTMTYNEYNYMTSDLDERQVGGNWGIDNGRKSIITLNSNNKLLTRNDSAKFTLFSDWILSGRQEFNYLPDDTTLSSVLTYFWRDSSWQEYERMIDISFYNNFQGIGDVLYWQKGTGDITTLTRQRKVQGVWTNFFKMTASYLAEGKELTNLTETWDTLSNSWQGQQRRTQTYDSYQNITSIKYESFSKETQSWNVALHSRFSYEYNADSTISVESEEILSFGQWVKRNRKVHFYLGTTSIDEDVPDAALRIYPNPSSENIIIEGAVGEIILLNHLGQPVWSSTSFGGNVQIDLTQFVSGHYVLKMTTPLGIQTQKIIISR